MTRRIGRQLATTAVAVMIASGFPLAQEGPAEMPRQTTGAPAVQGSAELPPRLVDREPDAGRTREEFSRLLDRHPPTLRQVFRLDPTLLTDAEYLAP